MRLALPISQLINSENVKDFYIDVYQYRAGYSFDKGIETKGKELIFHDSKGLIGYDFYDNFNLLIPYFRGYDFKLYSTNLVPACIMYEKVRGDKFEYFNALSRILEPGEIIEIAREAVKYIYTHFDRVAIENSNRYPYPAHKVVCNPHFLTEVVEALDVSFCFDLSHALISYYNYYYNIYGNTLNSLLQFLNMYPLHRCVEVHLSSAGSKDEKSGLYFDRHFAPEEFEFKLLEKLLPSIPGDPYIAVEYYRNLDILKKCYDRLRMI